FRATGINHGVLGDLAQPITYGDSTIWHTGMHSNPLRVQVLQFLVRHALWSAPQIQELPIQIQQVCLVDHRHDCCDADATGDKSIVLGRSKTEVVAWSTKADGIANC